jgi:hypothetical protein
MADPGIYAGPVGMRAADTRPGVSGRAVAAPYVTAACWRGRETAGGGGDE